MEKPPTIVTCVLPTSEGVFCGVSIEPYCLFRRGDNQPLNVEELPEEGSTPSGEGGNFALRCRWYRSNLPRAGSFCSVHPEREASLQCMICVKCRVAQHLSYHCSPDCLKNHWHIHRDYHKQQTSHQSNGENSDDDGRRTGRRSRARSTEGCFGVRPAHRTQARRPARRRMAARACSPHRPTIRGSRCARAGGGGPC